MYIYIYMYIIYNAFVYVYIYIYIYTHTPTHKDWEESPAHLRAVMGAHSFIRSHSDSSVSDGKYYCYYNY